MNFFHYFKPQLESSEMEQQKDTHSSFHRFYVFTPSLKCLLIIAISLTPNDDRK
jgi:hypothetical protein